ncbi:DUF6879 family protein [Amycolatopsis japonica]|uniref:DUF6879 family protein n=1 Tax=Amycolatopsis japonica TaxID=208439 RepID=UPI00331AD49A
MNETRPNISGHRLTLEDYIDDYKSRFWKTNKNACWKLERQQTFRELNNPSWEASSRGDWPRALELLQKGRPEVKEYQERILAHGFEFRRVRVVEEPITPYLIWELNSLLIRHEYGERIRIITPDLIKNLEPNGPLPEIVVIGTDCVYQVLYDSDGLAEGAIQSTNKKEIKLWIELIAELYQKGEDINQFHDRKIAALQP